MVRGAAVLPHSWQTGLRIAVFAEGAAAEEARAAGTCCCQSAGRNAHVALTDRAVGLSWVLKPSTRGMGLDLDNGAATHSHSPQPLMHALYTETHHTLMYTRSANTLKPAGADIIGSGELVASILSSKGKSIDFTACLATPDMMPQLVKLGRILGPKGLMPNPKVKCRLNSNH